MSSSIHAFPTPVRTELVCLVLFPPSNRFVACNNSLNKYAFDIETYIPVSALNLSSVLILSFPTFARQTRSQQQILEAP